MQHSQAPVICDPPPPIGTARHSTPVCNYTAQTHTHTHTHTHTSGGRWGAGGTRYCFHIESCVTSRFLSFIIPRLLSTGLLPPPEVYDCPQQVEQHYHVLGLGCTLLRHLAGYIVRHSRCTLPTALLPRKTNYPPHFSEGKKRQQFIAPSYKELRSAWN
jgi:hypothetical protein